MGRKADLVGKKFGKLTILREFGRNNRGQVKWECKCDCGGLAYAISNALTSGNTKSCGCTRVEKLNALCKKHGHAAAGIRPSITYESWNHMKQRCSNEKNSHFKNYGGRGISVCERWKSFELFLDDMGECPIGYSIERINVNGNYEPENCKWIPKNLQSRNTTRTVLSEILAKEIRDDFTNGMKRREIIKKYNLRPGTIDSVIYNNSWIEI